MQTILKNLNNELLHLAYLANGFNVKSQYRWLVTTLSWTPSMRKEWRLNMLNQIIDYAWKHVAFYRIFWSDHGIKRRPLKSIEELQVYPILRKDVFIKNHVRIMSDNLINIKHIKKCSGGTTGKPINYLVDKEQWSLMQAFHWWGWSLAGYKIGDKVGILAGGSLIQEATTLQTRARLFLERRLFLHAVNIDEVVARDYHHRLEKYGAKFLYGYPSYLYMFAMYLKNEHLRLPSIKAVITTSEILLPKYRRTIEEVFKCSVYDDYGCNDGGVQSYECTKHQGLHYNDLQSILDVNGEENDNFGKLVITNLWNKSMPFVRYENGDIVELSKSLCDCMSPFPIIKKVEGRTYDLIHFGNGQNLSGSTLVHIMGHVEANEKTNSSILEYQAVQTKKNVLELRIRTETILKSEAIKYINVVFYRYFKPEIELIIKVVGELEKTNSGKLKFIWTQIEK